MATQEPYYPLGHPRHAYGFENWQWDLLPTARWAAFKAALTAIVMLFGTGVVYRHVTGHLPLQPINTLPGAILIGRSTTTVYGLCFGFFVLAASFSAFVTTWYAYARPQTYTPWRLRFWVNLTLSTLFAYASYRLTTSTLGWSERFCLSTSALIWALMFGMLIPLIVDTRYRRGEGRTIRGC